MLRKLFLLISILLIVFSIQSFGQDSATKSVHPKMDKYYPRPQKTQVLNNNNESPFPTKPVTQTSSAPVMATVPAANNAVVNPAPTITPTTPAPLPAEPQIQAGPAVTSTPVSVEPSNTVINSSNSVSAPAAVTVTAPIPKVVPKPKGPPPPPSYMDTRLGSSSPQYDTWEKNNNGAGSVTTQSKQ